MEEQIEALQRVVQQQFVDHQAITADLQARIRATEQGAIGAAAAAAEVTQANATTMAQALAAAGIGAPPKTDTNGKSTAKMPVFKKEEGEDFLIFEQKFRAYATLQKLSDDGRKLTLFMALEGRELSDLCS